MLMDGKKIDSVLGQIKFLESNILFLDLNKEMNIEIEEGVNFRNMILSLFGDQNFSIIIDTRGYTGEASMEMIQYFTQDEKYNKQCSCQAIIQNNLGVKLVANFYIQFLSKKVKAKLFTDYDSSLSWILKNSK
jgi:hypothetical protein